MLRLFSETNLRDLCDSLPLKIKQESSISEGSHNRLFAPRHTHEGGMCAGQELITEGSPNVDWEMIGPESKNYSIGESTSWKI